MSSTTDRWAQSARAAADREPSHLLEAIRAQRQMREARDLSNSEMARLLFRESTLASVDRGDAGLSRLLHAAAERIASLTLSSTPPATSEAPSRPDTE